MIEILSVVAALAVLVIIYIQRNKAKSPIPAGYRVSYSEFEGGFLCVVSHQETLETLVFGQGATEREAYEAAMEKLRAL